MLYLYTGTQVSLICIIYLVEIINYFWNKNDVYFKIIYFNIFPDNIIRCRRAGLGRMQSRRARAPSSRASGALGAAGSQSIAHRRTVGSRAPPSALAIQCPRVVARDQSRRLRPLSASERSSGSATSLPHSTPKQTLRMPAPTMWFVNR